MEIFIKCFITISWMFIAFGIIMLLSNNVFSPGFIANKILYYYDFNGKLTNKSLNNNNIDFNGFVPVSYSLGNIDKCVIDYPEYSYIDAISLITYGYKILLPFMSFYQALTSHQ